MDYYEQRMMRPGMGSSNYGEMDASGTDDMMNLLAPLKQATQQQVQNRFGDLAKAAGTTADRGINADAATQALDHIVKQTGVSSPQQALQFFNGVTQYGQQSAGQQQQAQLDAIKAVSQLGSMFGKATPSNINALAEAKLMDQRVQTATQQLMIAHARRLDRLESHGVHEFGNFTTNAKGDTLLDSREAIDRDQALIQMALANASNRNINSNMQSRLAQEKLDQQKAAVAASLGSQLAIQKGNADALEARAKYAEAQGKGQFYASGGSGSKDPLLDHLVANYDKQDEEVQQLINERIKSHYAPAAPTGDTEGASAA